MGSVGGPEILVILVVALLVLGPERLPEAARTVGRVVSEMRRMAAGFQTEFRDALQEPQPAYPPADDATPPEPASGPPAKERLGSGTPVTGEGDGSAS